MQITIELTDDQLDELARRVADHLSAGKPEPWISPEDAAEYLSVPVARIKSLAKQGKIPHGRNGRYYTFRLSELDKWISSCHLVATAQSIPLAERKKSRQQAT